MARRVYGGLKDKRPLAEFLRQYYEREGESKRLHRAVYRVGTTNLSNLTTKQLRELAIPILKEARERMKILREAGLTDSPAYNYMVKEAPPMRLSPDDNRQAIMNKLREGYTFLHSKTSLYKNAEEYSTWLDEHLGAYTTQKEREEIWDLVHRFEASHSQHFQGYGYDEAIKKIATAYILGGNDKDAAYMEFMRYLEGQGKLADLERGEGQELDKFSRTGISPWRGINRRNLTED